MEINTPTQTKQQNMKKSNSMKRSSSSHSDSRPHVESTHSPLRYGTPTFSDRGDPDPLDSPSSFQSASPDASPQKSPKYPDEKPNSKAIVAVSDNLTQCSPVVQKTVEPPQPPPSLLNLQKAVRENGPPPLTTVEPRAGVRFGAGRGFRTVEKLRVVNIGFRLIEVVLCLISFSVMAADKTKGWSGDSYDRYKEYRLGYYYFLVCEYFSQN